MLSPSGDVYENDPLTSMASCSDPAFFKTPDSSALIPFDVS